MLFGYIILFPFWLITASIFLIFPIYILTKIDYYCINDNTPKYCTYFTPTNITIIDFKYNRYIGSYVDKHTEYQCTLHDYHEMPNMGFSFMGYYQSNLMSKCVNENHRNNYISKAGKHSKINNSIGNYFYFIVLQITFQFIMFMWYIRTADKINKNRNETNNNYNQVNNPIVVNDVESVHPKNVEFKNIYTQLQSDHCVTTPPLNEICGICTNIFNHELSNESLVGLKCGHWYHKNCIETNKDYIKSQNMIFKCPTCQTKI